MVKRGKVVDERGRRWVSGELSSDDYWADARRESRERARQVVEQRLRGSDGDQGKRTAS